jgi:tRNA(Ile)-lysidine synthase
MILEQVRATIRAHALFGAGARVVLAVSGGSDSVALAEVARDLEQAGDLVVAGIAHFNHQLRPAAADDEAFVAAIAARGGWPFLAGRGDVAARAARERVSIETAGRAARYAFFAEARAHFAADVVALGHTRDDQAETFLLRLLRGAGPRGLASMHPRNGWIVRPLLDCRRAELRAYLAARGATFRDDATNADSAIPRNRVREELLPQLAVRFNPAIVDTLAEEAALAREQWSWIAESAEAIGATTAGSDEVVVDLRRLEDAHPALRRAVIWRAMEQASGGRPIAARHVSAALRVAGGAPALDAPGQRVEREGTRLVLRVRPPGTARRTAPANLFSYPLSIPGEVVLAEAGCVLSAELGEGAADGGAVLCTGSPRATVAVVRRDLCRGPLGVRNRRPGDRFRPSRLGQHKKLQDYFVDEKIARARRDRVPLVVDAAGRIVWVAGYAVDAGFRLTDPAQGMLILRLRQLGGPA